MNKTKMFYRFVVSPAILILLGITYTYAMIKHFVGFIKYGGEFITYSKDERKNIEDVYKLIQEEMLNKDVSS